MAVKSYLIGPFQTGQQDNVRPWLLPEDAFEVLEDAYVWRGRVVKRFGYSLIGSSDLNSRLRINLGNTDGSGDISVTVPGAVFGIGQMFSIGSEIFTVNATGTPATLLDTGAASVATYNTTTGALVINGAAATTPVYFYPGTPVMGLRTRELSTVNYEDVIAFDTQFAYSRSAGAWTRLGSAVWTGSDSDFFWSCNYRGANPYEIYFYTVNYTPADRIQYIPEGSTTWTSLRPQLDSGPTRYLDTALILLPFKDRLIALNTMETEGGSERVYLNRARFSQNGDPRDPTTSWLDDTPGRGGYIDAPTEEAITTAEFLKDRLIVYFERSTWELVYTGNYTLPFRWQQINTELGAESPFSIIPFDKGVLAFGNVGIHQCNGVNVERIDEKIPNFIFGVQNDNEGPSRVYGIRDYYKEVVYWNFPHADGGTTYPDRILVYNYVNNSWAIFYDSFTVFGYFQSDSQLTWADLGAKYGTWASWNDAWGSSRSQPFFPHVIAGNQQGFVFIIDGGKSSNSQSLYITEMDAGTQELTVIDHNLAVADYVLVEDCQGITSLNDTVFQVQEVVDADTIVLDATSFTGTYTGAGKLTRISNINIVTKQFNPGTPVGQQFRFPYIDFLLTTTSSGEVSVDYLLDSRATSVQNSVTSNVLLGTNTLSTQPEANTTGEDSQFQIWHRYFLQAQAQFIQLQIFMDDAQMKDLTISQSDFEMQAMLLYAEPTGRLIG